MDALKLNWIIGTRHIRARYSTEGRGCRMQIWGHACILERSDVVDAQRVIPIIRREDTFSAVSPLACLPAWLL